MANCAACWRSGRRSRRRARGTARSSWSPKARTAPTPRPPPSPAISVEDIPATDRRPRRSRSAQGAARPRCRRRDDHQPQHLRPVRARHEGDLRRGPRGGRLCLLRRRQLQRDRRPRAPGRSRHRRDAHQSAQDLLDPAWRRRAGFGAGGVLRGADALRAAALRREAAAIISRWSRKRPRASITRTSFGRMVRVPRPDGHVHPRADLYPQPRRRRPAPGRRGFGAQRQLHPAQSMEDALDAPFAKSGPCMHEAIFSDDGLARGLLDDRHRQGADRRGLSTR